MMNAYEIENVEKAYKTAALRAVTDEDQKIVVKAINRVRGKAGLRKIRKLKRGAPKAPRACPIAMSLTGTGVVRVSPLGWSSNKDAKHTFRSWETLQFTNEEHQALVRIILAVDEGRLPELVRQ